MVVSTIGILRLKKEIQLAFRWSQSSKYYTVYISRFRHGRFMGFVNACVPYLSGAFRRHSRYLKGGSWRQAVYV